MREIKFSNTPKILVTAGLLMTVMVLLFSAFGAAPKAHPLLVDMAQESPDQLVRLIVQKSAENQLAEALTAELGGKVVSDLSIIHAFSAEMTAADAVELSRSSAVRWVSLDAPVEEAGKPTPTYNYTVADYFDEVSFFNNDGSAGWSTPWLEEDGVETLSAAGDAVNGNVFISDGQLRLTKNGDASASAAVSRAVDLSDGVTSATLSYNFEYGPLVQTLDLDAVRIQISSDGGLSYTTLGTLAAKNGVSGSSFTNILGYASDDMRIRFEIVSGFTDPGEYFAVERVHISYEGNAFPDNTYLETLEVDDVWAMGYDGTGIGVAVIDSGITKEGDLRANIAAQKSFNANSTTVNDVYGHGTHVAGIIGMDGSGSDGVYYGIAPGADLLSLKVNDETGMAYESDVVAAMQWVYENMATYNIRVVNLSVNSTVESSYHNSPLDAAAEILWFNGVVVVTSAGNYWDGSDFNPVLAAPANDPFLITVGATDEKGTTKTRDDSIANYSAFGTTVDGYFKPDIYAPGSKIVSTLSGQSDWDVIAPERVVGGKYFRLSGTSMATPMVSGAVALLLQAEPDLTPDQVKFRLLDSAEWIGPSKYLNVYNLVTSTSTESANTGLEASQLLWTGDEPIVWGSVAWNSVAWNSVAWNSVAWNSVAWNSVAWNSVAWNE